MAAETRGENKMFGLTRVASALSLAALLFAGGLSAAFDTGDVVVSFSGANGEFATWSFEVDFGTTAHSETFNFLMTTNTSQGGFYEVTDCDLAANSTVLSAWQNANPIDFASAVVTSQLMTYTTPSYSGIKRFVVTMQLDNPSSVFGDVTVSADNGAQAGAFPLGGGVSFAPPSVTSVGTATTTQAQTIKFDGYVEFAAILRANEIWQFDIEADVGATANRKLGVLAWTVPTGTGSTTGAGTINYELHDLKAGGGYGTPQFTLSSNASTTTNTPDLDSYTIPGTGLHTFRVLVKPGAGFSTNVHVWIRMTFESAIDPQSPAIDPVKAPTTALTATPSGKTIPVSLGGNATETLTASGGTTPVSYGWVESGTWPAWASLSGTTGGTVDINITNPPAIGQTDVIVRLTNGEEWIEETYTIDVVSTPTITTTTLPDGQVGIAYNQDVVASGGVSPYTWAVISGSLPPGLSLAGSTTATASIVGTPTSVGTFNFTIEITDAGSGTDTQALTITVVPPPLTITTSTIADGVQGVNYNQSVVAVGGISPYSWSIIGGSMPPGITLATSTSLSVAVSGTPTVPGTYNFTVQIQDSISTTANMAFTVKIDPPPVSITTTTLPNGGQNSAYNQSITATGGAAPYTWSLLSGTLPPGLTLDTSATGLTTTLSGTPTSTGNYTFVVSVSDSLSSDSQSFSMDITLPTGKPPINSGDSGGCATGTGGGLWVAMLSLLAVVVIAGVRARRARG
ncbi:MAG: Ig domain-containing protein [Nitrospira sp.]|nr:Ig domain-containing protein [Nitrospira sp.]